MRTEKTKYNVFINPIAFMYRSISDPYANLKNIATMDLLISTK